MTHSANLAQALYSTLGDDPDLGEIVELFVEEMPLRVQHLLGRFDQRDWEGLRRAAHQLKGAAGSYGFDPLTPSASRLERAISAGRTEAEIRGALDELVELCRNVRCGPPCRS